MSLNKILSLVLVASFAVIASTPASAQRGGIGFGFSKFGNHSSINVNIRTGGGFYGHSFYRPTYCAPVVIVEPCRRWIPECYETQCVQVWVPGCERQVWVEPVYQTVCEPCGNSGRVLVSPGYFRTIIATPRGIALGRGGIPRG